MKRINVISVLVFLVLLTVNTKAGTLLPRLEDHQREQTERKIIRNFIGPRVHLLGCYKKESSRSSYFSAGMKGGIGSGWRIDYDNAPYVQTAAHVVVANYRDVFANKLSWEQNPYSGSDYERGVPFFWFKEHLRPKKQNFPGVQKNVKFWEIFVLENRPHENAVPEKIHLEIVGVSIEDDVALLKPITREDRKKLRKIPPCVLADYDKVETGDSVFSSSASLGTPWSFAQGYIIKKFTPPGFFGSFKFASIKVDKYFGPGGSGSAIFNLNGEVIAMGNTIDAPPLALGAAYGPTSDRLARLLPILTKGNLIGKDLGIEVLGLKDFMKEDIDLLKEVNRSLYNRYFGLKNIIEIAGLDDARGVIILNVPFGSAAFHGRLKTGDIITSVNGINVTRDADVIDEIHFGPDIVALEILRPKRDKYESIRIDVRAKKDNVKFVN